MKKSKLTLSGFEALSKGTLGEAGQNLYVSRKGALQRIWRFDVNNDGYVDLLIANSHDYNERPDLYVYHDPLGKGELQKLQTPCSQSGAVADLNGNGIDDVIIAGMHDGHHVNLPAYVYFGGRDGLTENRKIELSAPTCGCCRVGDFYGEGSKQVCFLIAECPEGPCPVNQKNHRLRVYRQTPNGFAMDGFVDYPVQITFFEVFDLDGDGCDDLYCRTEDGQWFILWGGPEGFSKERKTVVGPATDDKTRFDLLPFGGGNLRYFDFAKPKILTLGGKTYLFYAEAQQVRLIGWSGRGPSGEELIIPVANVISAGVGHIRSAETEDLVLLQVDGLDKQNALVYHCEDGFETPVQTLPVVTPRDLLLCDFNGNGHDDLVVVQGRDDRAYTTQSLLFPGLEDGTLGEEPRCFVTNNAVEAYAADFDGSGKRSLVFVNQQESSAYGHIPTYVYLGSKDGFSPENRLEFPGHSAGTMMPVDFNDDGYPDILVLHNAEDQPHLAPPANLYWGGSDGFDLEKRLDLQVQGWGGHCADINKDGYLDLIVCTGRRVVIYFGGESGFSEERKQVLEPVANPEKGIGNLWPALADLNGNGWLDLVVPMSWQNAARIYWGGPDGYSNENSQLLPVDCALTVRVADLNNNGYPDLVFGTRASEINNNYHQGTVTIFWGGPEGYSGYNCCVLPSYQSNSITIADFNNDGYLDIFASSYFNKRERDIDSFIYWNDHGNFSVKNRKRMFTHSSSAAWACDFNEDGYVDICTTHHRAYGNHNTESAIWWNGPEGFKEENRSWLPTIGPHDMVPNDAGNILTRGPEEWYITPAAEVDGLSAIDWTAQVPEKTWVNCQIRTANSAQELEKAAFVGPDGTGESRFTGGQTIPEQLVCGKWVQVKLYLGAVNSGNSPRVTAVSFF